MELKSLILGLVLSMGAFALKSGVGLGYAMTGSNSFFRQTLILIGFTFCYAGSFLLSALILNLADLAYWYRQIEVLFKSGMVIHMILAGLLAFWGVKLLSRKPKDYGRTKAWLFLAFPCPVCFSVILLNTGLITSLYPDRPNFIWWMLSGFILTSFVAAFVIILLGRRQRTENMLGAMMLYMAVYFILCVTIIPQFGDFETIYRISSPETSSLIEDQAGAGSTPGLSPVGTPGVILLAVGAFLALTAGFFNPIYNKRLI